MKTLRTGLTGARRKSSFTLIELLIVVALIAILISIAFRVTRSVFDKVDYAQTAYIIEQTRSAIEAYYFVKGYYPPTNAVSSSRLTGSTAGLPYEVGDPHQFDKTGLVYYLVWTDDPRKSSWTKYVSGVQPSVITYDGGTILGPPKAGFDTVVLSNQTGTIKDGWNRTIVYKPNMDDYQSYKLYSLGKDPNDPKDDIYGLESIR